MALLQVENVTVDVRQNRTEKNIVRDISFSVNKGQCLGILGESGSGKSMSLKAILGLLDQHFVIRGKAMFEGENLLELSKEQLRRMRGGKISMILQNPMNCFDPLDRIGSQMAEGILEHGLCKKTEVEKYCLDILEKMHIRDGGDVLKKYPHQLSGGMLQRIMIGLTLSGNPQIIIADEPTTAIDSITQYEIINEFIKIKQETDCAIIFITHDLGVISKIADHVIVMHNGQIVQQGDLESVLRRPGDEYTRELIGNKLTVMERFEDITKREEVGGVC